MFFEDRCGGGQPLDPTRPPLVSADHPEIRRLSRWDVPELFSQRVFFCPLEELLYAEQGRVQPTPVRSCI
jgi:hypothetical protein